MACMTTRIRRAAEIDLDPAARIKEDPARLPVRGANQGLGCALPLPVPEQQP